MKIFLYLLSVLMLVLSLLAIFALVVLLMFGVDLVFILPFIVVMGIVVLSTLVMMWKIYKTNRDLANMPVSINDASSLNRAEMFFYGGLGIIVVFMGIGGMMFFGVLDFDIYVFAQTFFPQVGEFEGFIIFLYFSAILLVSGFYLSFFSGLKLLKLRR